MKPVIVAIDFDGTVVLHRYPEVGEDLPHCVDVLKQLVAKGYKLILFTVRSTGNHLGDAVQWFNDREIPLWGINRNPSQSGWSSSPKAYANIYIDDTALGCPLINGNRSDGVDWYEVEKYLIKLGIL